MSRFAKVWDVKRYNQIAVIKQNGEDGRTELRVYFHPDGFGISSFVMAWPEKSQIDGDKVFSGMVMQDAIEVVDKFMAYSASEGNH